MEVTIRHSPSNAIVRCQLGGGEVLKVQPDAMVAHSAGMTLSAAADGGIMKGLKRKALGGESFFISTWTAPADGAGSTLPRICWATRSRSKSARATAC